MAIKIRSKELSAIDIGKVLSLVEIEAIFNQIYNIFAKGEEKLFNKEGTSLSQATVLWALDVSEKTLNLTEISRLLPLTNSSLSILLSKLEGEKLLRRKRSRTDKRVWELILTERGQEFASELYPIVLTYIISAFGIFTVREAAEFKRLLMKLRSNVIAKLEINPEHADLMLQLLDKSKEPIRRRLMMASGRKQSNSDLEFSAKVTQKKSPSMIS
jgi:DNA-binding MarR family transcriptional regulator